MQHTKGAMNHKHKAALEPQIAPRADVQMRSRSHPQQPAQGHSSLGQTTERTPPGPLCGPLAVKQSAIR